MTALRVAPTLREALQAFVSLETEPSQVPDGLLAADWWAMRYKQAIADARAALSTPEGVDANSSLGDETERSGEAVQRPLPALSAPMWPHVGADENGCATMEWWCADRKITLYLVASPFEQMLKSWDNGSPGGASDFVHTLDAHHVRNAFEWLNGTQKDQESR